MSITSLPNGRLRAQVYDPATGRNVSVAKVLGLPRGQSTWPGTRQGRRDAVKAREQARERLTGPGGGVMTVARFRERWLTDPLFTRPKASTNIHNAERTKGFAARYGTLPLAAVGDQTIAEWLAGGNNLSTVSSLRAMFNDAASAKAGRLITHNPFAALGIRRGTRARQQPPDEEFVWGMIRAARHVSCPSFAAWLQVACFTGMRPGELDALRWSAVDLAAGRIGVLEQFNVKTRTFTLPKNGLARTALLTPPARDALLALPRTGDFCFVNLRGDHWTPSGRAYHWKAVKAAVGWERTLYLATRHFAGWYMRNVLGLDSEDTAVALGHTDGGEQVRRTYGHLDEGLALERVASAYDRAGNVRPLRSVETA